MQAALHPSWFGSIKTTGLPIGSPSFSVRSSCLILTSPLPLTYHVQALFDDIKAHRIRKASSSSTLLWFPFMKVCYVLFGALYNAINQVRYSSRSHDHRFLEMEDFKPPNTKDDKAPEKPVARALLRPNSETLFADLCLLNQKACNKWSDKDALEVEAKVLVRNFSLFAWSILTLARYITTSMPGPRPTPRKDCKQSLPYFSSSHTTSITYSICYS